VPCCEVWLPALVAAAVGDWLGDGPPVVLLVEGLGLGELLGLPDGEELGLGELLGLPDREGLGDAVPVVQLPDGDGDPAGELLTPPWPELAAMLLEVAPLPPLPPPPGR
jgi:hypothetical protein